MTHIIWQFQKLVFTLAEGLRLLYSLTEGNDKAEWEDLTDSVDFQVTQNGSISFMTNVSARFWVVQIFEHETVPLVERLATSGHGLNLCVCYNCESNRPPREFKKYLYVSKFKNANIIEVPTHYY